MLVLLAVVPGTLTAAGCSSREPVDMRVEGPVQRLEISADGYFHPNLIRARPDMPIVLEFEQGRGCTTEVRFPDLDITASLRDESVTLEIGPLPPGSYAIMCEDDMRMGTLYVE